MTATTTTNPSNPQEAEVEYSPIKIIVLGAFFVAASLIFGYTLRGFITTPGLNNLLYLGLAFIGFDAVFALQTIFLKTLQTGALAILLAVLAFSIFFYKSISLLLVLTALVVFLIFLQAIASGQAEIGNVLKIKFLRIVKPVITKSSMALALFGVVLFVISMNLTDVRASKRAVEFLTKSAKPIVVQLLGVKDFSFNYSLRDIFISQLPPEVQALPTALKNQAVDEAIKKIDEQISGLIKVSIKPTDTLNEIIYNATLGKLLTLSKTIQTLILIVLGLLLFLLVKSVLFIFNFLALIVAFIFYELLFLSGFFHVSLESRGKEVIILK